MALSAQQKIYCRDHLCVPFAGIPMSSYTAGIRTILTVGQLEFYLNALQVEEECVLTGYPYGQINIFGQLTAGSSGVTATVNGVPVTYTASAADVANHQPLQAFAGGLAQAINLSTAGVMAASGSITSGDVAPAALPVYGQVTIVNPATFTVSASGSNGLNAVIVANGGTYPWPQYTFTKDDGTSVTYYGYINICNYLLSRILESDSWLSYAKADVVEFRKDEIEKRVQLYNYWRTRMGNALSVGPNPAGTQGMGSSFGITA